MIRVFIRECENLHVYLQSSNHYTKQVAVRRGNAGHLLSIVNRISEYSQRSRVVREALEASTSLMVEIIDG
jgi:hypothetical protein